MGCGAPGLSSPSHRGGIGNTPAPHGAVTSRYYGLSTGLLSNYAWFDVNSQKSPKPCGSLIPNDFGLFDMLGNAWEWCHDEYKPYQPGIAGRIIDERETRKSELL